MNTLRLVQYDRPRAFLDAVQAFDDTNLSFAAGEVYDRLNPLFTEGGESWEIRAAGQHTFMAAWKADQLMYV